jgi:hypothetical protein
LPATHHRSGQEQAKHGVFPKVLWLATDARRVEAIAGLVARLPAAEQELFAVARLDEALSAIAPEDTADNALQNTF